MSENTTPISGFDDTFLSKLKKTIMGIKYVTQDSKK